MPDRLVDHRSTHRYLRECNGGKETSWEVRVVVEGVFLMSSYVTLHVEHDQLVAKPGLKVASTSVSYATDRPGVEVEVYERLDEGPNVGQLTRVDLRARIQAFNEQEHGKPEVNEDWKQRGTFLSPVMSVGFVYRVEAYVSGTFPNDRQDAHDVFVLAEEPSPTPQIADRSIEAGGTFVGVALQTPRSAVVFAEAAEHGSPLDTLSNGAHRFTKPIARRFSTAYGHRHEFSLIGDFHPGNNYDVLLRASNEVGDWEEIIVPVTLLKRRVEISFDQLRIINDSDPGGSGEDVRLVVYAYEGTHESYQVSNTWETLTDGQQVALPSDWKATLGPAPVDDDATAVTVKAWLTEDDSPMVSEDASGDEKLRIPTGLDEELAPTAFTIAAAPWKDDDLEGVVQGTYSVTYS
jgi:hypothetical protein